MFTILSNLIGEMKLWKAVVIFAAIVGIAGWGLWSKHQPQTIDSGTWTIEPGSFEGTGFSLNRDANVQAEFTPAAGNSAKYVGVIVTFSEMLTLPTTPAKNLQGLAHGESTGTLKLGPTLLERSQSASQSSTPTPSRLSFPTETQPRSDNASNCQNAWLINNF